MLVREIMHRRVARIPSNSNLLDLIRLFAREPVSGVPVVEPYCQLVGVVSIRDVMRWLGERLVDQPLETLGPALEKTSVSEIMTPTVHAVSPEASVDALASTLRKERIHRAFVIDRGRLCGVVSTFDLLRGTRPPEIPARGE